MEYLFLILLIGGGLFSWSIYKTRQETAKLFQINQKIQHITGLNRKLVDLKLSASPLDAQTILYFVAQYSRFPNKEETEYIEIHGLPAFNEYKNKA